MNWLTTHWLQLSFLTGYLAILVYHSLEASRRIKGVGDYLVAGRSLGGWVVALSFYATFVSTNTFVGHAGKSWDVGLIWYVKGAVIVVFCYMAWYLVAPRFYSMALKYGSLTLPDFLGTRYKSPALRRCSAGVVFLAALLYTIAVYKGSAHALEAFLGLDYRVAAFAIFVVVTAYTLTGGFRSVVMTDAIQGSIMVVGAVAILAAVLVKGGGLGAILASVKEQDPMLVSWQGRMPMLTVLGLSLSGGVKMLVDPRQVSRILGLRDEKALKLARIVSPLLILVTYVCLIPIGTLAHALLPPEAIVDTDRVMPTLLGTSQILGPVFSSFFLLVLLSAAMSSLDSVLLVAASSIGRDIVIITNEDPRAIKRTRFWVVVLSAVSMYLALNPFGGIVEITSLSGSFYAACFVPTLVIGLYWKKATATGALTSVVLGVLTVGLWYFAKRAGWTDLHEVYVGFGVGLLSYLAVSYFTIPNSAEKRA